MVQTQNNYEKNLKNNKTLIILLIAGFVSMMNETALNIAFPQIMIQFHVSAGIVQWLTTIYVLVSGIVFLTSAFLIERFSTRNLFSASIIFLIIGTVVAGFSSNFTILLTGRLIQAIGTGILVPLIFTVTLLTAPSENRGSVMGLTSMVILFAPVIAPVFTGLVMKFTDWHYIFLIVFLLFIFAIFGGLSFLRNVTELGQPKLDISSVILAIFGFGGITLGFSNIGDNGFLSTYVIIPLIIGVVSLIIFIKRQLTLEYPILNLHPFKYSSFSMGILINTINIMTIFAITIILPIYLQEALGLTSFIASLVMLPGGILNGLLPLLSGKIYDKRGPRIIISTGLAIMCIAMLAFSQLTTVTSLLIIVLLYMVFFIGGALMMAPNQANTLGNLPVEYYPSGSAIMTSLQQMSGSIGSSLFVSFMSIGESNYISHITNPTAIQNLYALVSGVNFSFLIAGILLALAFIFSLFLKKEVVNI